MSKEDAIFAAKVLFATAAAILAARLLYWSFTSTNLDFGTRMILWEGGAGSLVFLLWWSYSKMGTNTDASTQTAVVASPDDVAPNLFCEGTGDLGMTLDSEGIFREGSIREDRIRGFTAIIHNRPNPPNKVGLVRDVGVEIIYWDIRFPDMPREIHRVNSPCWLNEKTPKVDFPLNKKHELILGAMRPHLDKDGYQTGFRIYSNDPSSREYNYNIAGHYLIEVNLVAGNHGEHGQSLQFKLDVDEGNYGLQYLSPELKAQIAESDIEALEYALKKGEILFDRYRKDEKSGNEDPTKAYHDWASSTEGYIRRTYGVRLQVEFRAMEKLKKFRGRRSEKAYFVDEFYRYLTNLREIVREKREEIPKPKNYPF